MVVHENVTTSGPFLGLHSRNEFIVYHFKLICVVNVVTKGCLHTLLGSVVHRPNNEIKPCLKGVAFGRMKMMKHFEPSSKDQPLPQGFLS